MITVYFKPYIKKLQCLLSIAFSVYSRVAKNNSNSCFTSFYSKKQTQQVRLVSLFIKPKSILRSNFIVFLAIVSFFNVSLIIETIYKF